MPGVLSTITIGIDPTIEIGPLTLAWHGITIALGILIGGVVAGLEARRRGLDREPLYAIGMILVAGALVGGRLYYLVEHDGLFDTGEWFGSRGYTFYGGFIAAALGIAFYVWRKRLSVEYLDAVAFGLSLGNRDRPHRRCHQRRALRPIDQLLPRGPQHASRRRCPESRGALPLGWAVRGSHRRDCLRDRAPSAQAADAPHRDDLERDCASGC